MSNWAFGQLAAAALLMVSSAAAWAQKIAPGVYSIPDSGYSITVQQQGTDLLVDEAGKQRRYTGQGDGSYRYFNPNTGSTFELRFRDRGAITALKLGSGSTPTVLMRRGGPAPEDVAAPASGSTAAAPSQSAGVAPGAPPPSPFLAVAEKYQALALSDKKDVQSWAFCSAAALKRSMATKADADAYGREAAERLASISVDPGKNPCPDAIPADLWPAPIAAESEALKAANADALAAAARQREEIAAMKAKAAADQAAFERAQAEHRAALAKSQAAQEAYAREQAAYKAAAAEYQRQLEAAKRSGKQGN